MHFPEIPRKGSVSVRSSWRDSDNLYPLSSQQVSVFGRVCATEGIRIRLGHTVNRFPGGYNLETPLHRFAKDKMMGVYAHDCGHDDNYRCK